MKTQAVTAAGSATSPSISGLVPLTYTFYLVLLAGQFGFERIGMQNPFGVPERLAGLLLTLFFAVVFRSVGASHDRRKVHLTVLISMPSLVALLSAWWGPSGVPDFSATVTDLVCTIVALAIAAILIGWDAQRFSEHLLGAMAVSGLVFSLAGLAVAAPGGRAAAFGGGPNVFSRITMLGVVAIIALVLLKKLPNVALLAIPLMLIATIGSGSRGGMLAGIVALLVMLPLAQKVSLGRRVAAAIALIGCSAFVYQRYADIINASIGGRVVELTFNQGYSSGRDQLLSSAMDLYRQHPLFGSGLRSFAEHYGQGFTYPHNLFIHYMSESGLFGLGVVLTTLAVCARHILQSPRHQLLPTIFSASAALILTSAMFSGDYYDNRFLWIFLLLAVNTRSLTPDPTTQSKQKSIPAPHGSRSHTLPAKPLPGQFASRNWQNPSVRRH